MRSIALALLSIFLIQPAEARVGSSWGGSILIVDMSSGTIIKEWVEPCMFDGYSGTEASVSFQTDERRKFLELDWSDVVYATDSAHGFSLMGEPGGRKARSLRFSLPDLAVSTEIPARELTDAALTHLPFAGADGLGFRFPDAPKPPNLPIPWDEQTSVLSWSKEVFYIWTGENLDCYDFASGKKLWHVDFNPKNLMLPGGQPDARVYESGDKILVATDRLGMRALDRKTGALLWYVDYGNVDVIPILVSTGSRLILAPASRDDGVCRSAYSPDAFKSQPRGKR